MPRELMFCCISMLRCYQVPPTSVREDSQSLDETLAAVLRLATLAARRNPAACGIEVSVTHVRIQLPTAEHEELLIDLRTQRAGATVHEPSRAVFLGVNHALQARSPEAHPGTRQIIFASLEAFGQRLLFPMFRVSRLFFGTLPTARGASGDWPWPWARACDCLAPSIRTLGALCTFCSCSFGSKNLRRVHRGWRMIFASENSKEEWQLFLLGPDNRQCQDTQQHDIIARWHPV